MSHQGQHPSLSFGASQCATNAVLAIAILFTLMVALTGSAQAQTYTERMLYSFKESLNGDKVLGCRELKRKFRLN